ncbi:MAG: M56 family metallopeptidase [Lachnospiraceae bacterium]|nr:M56 family metallopeptidase [Lachnospiraceae bacterium]
MGMRVTEAFLTSSVLIAVVLILRRLCRGKISLCLQYGIWLIVAVKLLLVPVPFLESPFSIMNLLGLETKAALAAENAAGGGVPGTDSNTDNTYVFDEPESDRIYLGAEEVIRESAFMPAEESSSHSYISTGKNSLERSSKAGKFLGDFLDALPFLLYVNAFLLAAWMVFYNIRVYHKLRSIRIPYEEKEDGKGSKNPKIYLVEELKTPCLYGMSIYLPIDTPKDEKKMRHILAHETVHYRHKDFIWSFLRLVCIALNWYNPFVWIAAAAEKQDCELACDEAAIKMLGEEERVPYGETLIRLVGEKTPQDILTLSTTMTASTKEIRTRISLIAKKPVTVSYIAVIAAIVLSVAVFCTFTGKVEAAGKGRLTVADTVENGNSQTAGELYRKYEVNGGGEDDLPAGHSYEPIESETAETDKKESEPDLSEEVTGKEELKEYTGEELAEEFAGLTENNTFSVYIRSISRSAKEIDLFSMEIWNHIESPSDYGSLAFAEDCLYHFYSFDPELGGMEFQDVDFDRFVNELSLDGRTDVECKVTCKGGLVTDIVAYKAYGSITYSEPVEGKDYYDLHGIEGYQLAGTYMADISEAEGTEKIYIYSGNMGDGDGGFVVVEKWGSEDGQPGEVLWVEEAHTSRAGWNNVYLGKRDGKEFLFTLSIDVRDGFGTLTYHAFRLDADGNPLPYSGAKFTYETETYEAGNFTQWYSSMSAYMNRSVLLLSTQDGVLKTAPDTTYDSNPSYNAVSGSSSTAIPAPEEGGYELIELQDMIEENMF